MKKTTKKNVPSKKQAKRVAVPPKPKFMPGDKVIFVAKDPDGKGGRCDVYTTVRIALSTNTEDGASCYLIDDFTEHVLFGTAPSLKGVKESELQPLNY